MRSYLFENWRLMHWWRKYTVSLHLQNTRHYALSSRFLASKSLPSTKRLINLSPAAKFPNNRPHTPKVSQRLETNGPRRQPWFKFKWFIWAKDHKPIAFYFCMFSYWTLQFPLTLQRVPITERKELNTYPTGWKYILRLTTARYTMNGRKKRSTGEVRG